MYIQMVTMAFGYSDDKIDSQTCIYACISTRFDTRIYT